MSKAIVMTQAEIDRWQREEAIATGPGGIRATMIARAKALGKSTGQGTWLAPAANARSPAMSSRPGPKRPALSRSQPSSSPPRCRFAPTPDMGAGFAALRTP